MRSARRSARHFECQALRVPGTSGFTLVELMISASILAFGMVLVARGLLTASSTLRTVDNRVSAYLFLEDKLMDLQRQAVEEGGLAPAQETGTTDFSGRPATWTLDIAPVSLTSSKPRDPTAPPGEGEGSIVGVTPEEAAGQTGTPQQEEPPKVSFAKVTLEAAWRENNRPQDAVLVTYVGYKPKPGEGGAEELAGENPS